MKHIELRREENVVGHDPRNTLYFADNKRISREAFDDIRRAAVVHDSFCTVQDGGVYKFHSVARVP